MRYLTYLGWGFRERTWIREGFLLDQEAMITRLLQDHQITLTRKRHIKKFFTSNNMKTIQNWHTLKWKLDHCCIYRVMSEISYATMYILSQVPTVARRRHMCYLNQTKSKKLRIVPTHIPATPWGSLVSWASKRQSTSLSTTESEYVALSNGCRRAQVISNFAETTIGKTCLT